jgi:hypothetical protein
VRHPLSGLAWERYGLKPVIVDAAIVAGYRLGIGPERLAAWRRPATAR